MQSSLVTLICGSHVISSTPAYVIRGMVNSMAITLLNDAGTALDITDVSTWDLGITEDFFGKTGVLAGSSTITAAENVLAVTMNGHTEELASLMDGKQSIQAYATLRGRDASDVLNRLYVFPVVILNIGFTNDTILTTAAQELTYTKAQIDYLLSQLPGGTGAEKIENKTQEIDTEEPSAEKYPSEAATVAYGSGKVDKVDGKVLSDNNFTDAYKTKVDADVEAVTALPSPAVSLLSRVYFLTADDGTKKKGTTWKCVADGESYVFQQIQTDLNQLTDTTGLFAAKEDAANKATDFAVIDDNKFPTVKAVKDFAQNETLTELTGTDVTVAPWTQSKWSASGTCTLTASGWAESGRQVAYIIITLAVGATPSIIGTEAVEDGDALSAAGVYECFIKNVDGKIYFRQISFTEVVA